jgi:hypothetical protein
VKGTPAQILDASLTKAPFWSAVKVLRLTTNMRLLAQQEHMRSDELEVARSFSKWLLDVGNGSPAVLDDHSTITIPEGKTTLLCSTFVLVICLLSRFLSSAIHVRYQRPYWKSLPLPRLHRTTTRKRCPPVLP